MGDIFQLFLQDGERKEKCQGRVYFGLESKLSSWSPLRRVAMSGGSS